MTVAMTLAYAAVVAGAFGLIFGSFLNVVAYRLPRGESLAYPASRCPSLRDPDPAVRQRPGPLVARAAREMPIVQDVDLGALSHRRGRHVPAAGGGRARQGGRRGRLLGIAFVLLLVPVTLIDLDHRIIPNKLMLIGTVVSITLVLLTQPDSLTEHLIAAAGAGGFLLIAALAYPAGMGMGDVKLAAVMGLFLGRAVGPAMFVALITGSVVGALIIARKGAKEGRKTAIPFGPYLAFGGLVGLFAGDAIVDWYLDTFV